MYLPFSAWAGSADLADQLQHSHLENVTPVRDIVHLHMSGIRCFQWCHEQSSHLSCQYQTCVVSLKDEDLAHKRISRRCPHCKSHVITTVVTEQIDRCAPHSHL